MLTRGLERSRFYRERVPLILKRAWVFAYVCFAWIFFRASSLSDAGLIVGRIFSAAWEHPQMPALMLVLVGVRLALSVPVRIRLRDLLSSASSASPWPRP